MKKIIFLITIVCFSFNKLSAQEANRFKLGLNLGATASPEFGLLLGIEPKYNITNSSAVGLQVRVVSLLSRDIENLDKDYVANNIGYSAVSVMAIYEKYLITSGKFHPFIVGGLGYFKAFDEETFSRFDNGGAIDSSVQAQIGFNLGSGFDLGRFRLGLDYTLVPKAAIKIANDETIGQVNDSYISIYMGFTFGGGKFK